MILWPQTKNPNFSNLRREPDTNYDILKMPISSRSSSNSSKINLEEARSGKCCICHYGNTSLTSITVHHHSDMKFNGYGTVWKQRGVRSKLCNLLSVFYNWLIDWSTDWLFNQLNHFNELIKMGNIPWLSISYMSWNYQKKVSKWTHNFGEENVLYQCHVGKSLLIVNLWDQHETRREHEVSQRGFNRASR